MSGNTQGVLTQPNVGTKGTASSKDELLSMKKGTTADQHDMERLGKTQETKRNFRFITIVAFTMVLMSTWEAQFSASGFVINNGGRAGAIWMYLGTFICFLTAIASMAEMSSMAPTTGGQYHWVSEFGPAYAQKQLSYTVGWLCLLGWQVGNTAIAYLCGTILQGMVALNNPSYEPTRWQAVLIIWAVLTFSLVFNTTLASGLPILELIVATIHVLGFFAILIVLWVYADPDPASDVFTSFYNGGGWSTQGAACLVGILSPVFSFVGPDAATYMAEELQDASRSLPRAMMWAAISNGAMGFVMIITFMMMLGDPATALDSATGYPFIDLFYRATGSMAGTTVMVTLFFIMLLFGSVTSFATSSRQMWAFVSSHDPSLLIGRSADLMHARDNGTPFSSWLSRVRPGYDLPVNAVLVTWAFAMLLTFINLGSDVALNIITSLGVGALTCSYIISISCIIRKRLVGEPLLPRPWSLGIWGLPLNLIGVAFLILVFVMNFFPQSPRNLDATTFNWNILIFMAAVLIAGINYAIKGQRDYDGPVAYVRKDV